MRRFVAVWLLDLRRMLLPPDGAHSALRIIFNFKTLSPPNTCWRGDIQMYGRPTRDLVPPVIRSSIGTPPGTSQFLNILILGSVEGGRTIRAPPLPFGAMNPTLV